MHVSMIVYFFWKENADLEMCPVCEEPRYKLNDGKGKKIPNKILRYFPLTLGCRGSLCRA